MTPEQLKASILQLAIQGKLVPQRPEEGTAEELYQQIQREKKKLIAAGKLKKEKLHPPISEEEIPFDIPDSWKWVRVSSIANVARGGSPRPIKEYLTDGDDGINWIMIGDSVKGSKYISGTKKKIRKDGMARSRVVESGDLLLSNSMSYGRPYILRTRGCIHDGWLVLQPYMAEFNREFLFYVFSSNCATIQFSIAAAGAVVKNLNENKVASVLIPLPPLSEQQRIVEKIEQMLPLVEQYGEAYTALESLDARFPDDMRKSILQYAIQGKLVPQRPEEGTAEELYQQIQQEKKKLIAAGKLKKEKPLPPITEEEIPFDIPDSWKWVRLGELYHFINGDRGKNYPAKNTLHKQGIPFISAINIRNKSVSHDGLLCVSEKQFQRLRSGHLVKGDIVVCIRGSLGKFCVYPFEQGAIASSLVILRHIAENYDKFVEVYLDTFYFQAEIAETQNGTAQPNLSAKDFANFILPLPPLAEQQRIVEKIEQMLSLIGQTSTPICASYAST